MPAVLDHQVALDPEADVISDEELTALALAADVDRAVAPDARPWTGATETADGERADLLPDFYMPAPVTGARSPWQRAMGLTFVGALLLINVSGLCVTYGVLELA